MVNGHFTIIIWKDAHSTLDERTKEEIIGSNKPNVIHTNGYVVAENDECVSIAGEWIPASDGGDETFRNITCIMRVNIIERQEIKKTTKRKKKGAVPVQEVSAPISVDGREEGA